MVAVTAATLLLLSLVTFSFPKGGDSSPATKGIDQTIIDKSHSIDGYFIENRGQVADGIRYYSRGNPGNPSVGFRDDGVMFVLTEVGGEREDKGGEWKDSMRLMNPIPEKRVPAKSYAYVMRFEGSNRVTPVGMDELPFKSNFFIGDDPSKWRTGARNYREIVYHNLYDAIDLVYRVRDRLKYELIVQPGADLSAVELSFEGVGSLRIEDGDLVADTGLGVVRDTKPVSHQGNHEVSCGFVLKSHASYGFMCNGIDSSAQLVIDPLIYSTFFGGTEVSVGGDMGGRLALDSHGNAYVTGIVQTLDFPVTPGAFDTFYNGSDVFVTKLNPTGSALAYSTYLGGRGRDDGYSIAVDSLGSAYVTGYTQSLDFPVTLGSFDITKHGSLDVFVTKLNPSGSALVYSTFLGGNGSDVSISMVVDDVGSAYVAGCTASVDFPVTPGVFDAVFNGDPNYADDAFLVKLNATGETLAYSTFLGGNGSECAYSIAVDSVGNVFIAGVTSSADFPLTKDAPDVSLVGYWDAFVTELNSAGTALIFSTYLGGSANESANSIVVDSSGNAYLVGVTGSDDFPTTSGVFDDSYGGGMADAFVTKLSENGTSIAYSTYLGGKEEDNACSIALDSTGNAYVVGQAWSTDFPTTPGAFDETFNGDDVYLAKLNETGSTLTYSTFLGGDMRMMGIPGFCEYSVALDPVAHAYVSGLTASPSFPTTPGAFDTTMNGWGDIFVLKIFPKGGSNTVPKITSFAAIPYPSLEGGEISFSVEATDAENDPLTYSFDFESDGMFDVIGHDNTTTRLYGDDFYGTATVRVSDGDLGAWANTTVFACNLPPSIDTTITANVTGNLTLRVAGEKWHDVSLTIYRDSVAVANASVIRTPGSPDDQAATIENVTIDLLSGNLSAVVTYTPDDDPVNGQPNGANPAWLILTARDGSESRIHHTFNVRHDDTWIWRVDDLRALLVGMNLTFTATATDPGSDDLTFTWEWGDWTPATARTYYNDGTGPDPYPSPGGTFPFTATDRQTHAYAVAGTYDLKVRVSDDDGGNVELHVIVIMV